MKVLAEKAGVPLVFDQKADGERDRLYAVMEEAAKYFEAQLLNSKEATEYVKGRGISDTTKKEFRIGWAPDAWRNLSIYLKGKGFNELLMEKAGLVKKKEKNDPSFAPRSSEIRRASNDQYRTSAENIKMGEAGQLVEARRVGESPDRAISSTLVADKRVERPVVNTSNNHPDNSSQHYYDRFRGRIMFPIFDSSGRVIAFSGRILKADDQSAKYINSPDTPLYDKSQVLYGLDKAKNEIRRMNYSIFVEGQMDLVMSHQAGIKNTVAASGTAMGDETENEAGIVSNLGLVRRLSPNVIIAFDSDSAGKKASMRAAGIALSLGMDVKIAEIVGGKDPADLVKENVTNWKTVLRNAKPVVEFELNNVLADNPDSRKLPRALRERVFPFLVRIESSMDKAHFVKMIADRAKITESAVWDDLKKMPAPNSIQQTGGSSSTSKAGSGPSFKGIEGGGHIDLVSRRIFGLLALMEKKIKEEAEKYRELMKNIAGDRYEEHVSRSAATMVDHIFEAEALYGEDEPSWHRHMKELLFNYEIDMINDELVKTMQELKA
ncbi:MAG: toprim domain-containing protein, partial [Candidatus Taylorbacteria bacterium]|nr:toprim domain-containing protein [Candidatus Taylorbacteria bacterium]